MAFPGPAEPASEMHVDAYGETEQSDLHSSQSYAVSDPEAYAEPTVLRSEGVNQPPSPPEDDLAVVRFEDDHVVSGRIVDDLPPEPAITLEDRDEKLVVDSHDDYDVEVLQTTEGHVATAGGEVIERVDDDPDLVIVDGHGTVDDRIEVDRDSGRVRTVDGGEPVNVTINGEDIGVVYPAYDEHELVPEITDVTEADEGEPLKVTASINNTRWGHADSETVQLQLMFDSEPEPVANETVTVSSGGEVSETLEYEPKSGDFAADEVRVKALSSGITDSTEVNIDAAGAAVFISETNKPMVGSDLTVTAGITRYGNIPEGEQSYPITFYVDGEEKRTAVVTLGPGEATTQTFAYETQEDDAPEVEVEVGSRTDSDTVDVPVVATDEHESNIQAAINGTSIDSLELDGELEVDAVFDYDGEVPTGEAEFTADFVVDGTVEERRNVTLSDSSTTEETFTYDRAAEESPITNVTIFTPGENASVTFDRETELSVTDVTEPAARNHSLETTVAVEDIGETPGTETMHVEVTNPVAVEGDPVVNRTISLESGESTTETITFDVTEEAPPELELRANTSDAVATRTVEVRDDVVNFEIENATLQELDGPDGGIEVSGTFRNAGGVTGSQTVQLTFDGEPIRSEELTLEPDEEATLSASIPVTADDTYSYGATTDDDSTRDTATVETGSETGILSSIPITGSSVAVVLASLLGVALIGAGVVKYRDDPASVRAQARQLRNAVLDAVPLGDSGTVVVQNDLPRTSLVRVRVRSGNDVVFLEDFEIDESERRTFDCLPDAERFEVGAGVDDITSHEETFGEGTDTVAVVLRPEGITIRELQ